MNNDFPRRNQVDKMLPAELAILKAMEEVEKLPADIGLTDAIVFLSGAKNKVSDYIDAHPELLPSEENTNDENHPENGNGGVEVPKKPPPPEP